MLEERRQRLFSLRLLGLVPVRGVLLALDPSGRAAYFAAGEVMWWGMVVRSADAELALSGTKLSQHRDQLAPDLAMSAIGPERADHAAQLEDAAFGVDAGRVNHAGRDQFGGRLGFQQSTTMRRSPWVASIGLPVVRFSTGDVVTSQDAIFG